MAVTLPELKNNCAMRVMSACVLCLLAGAETAVPSAGSRNCDISGVWLDVETGAEVSLP